MKRLLPAWDSLLIASMVLLAGVCAQSQQRAAAEESEQGEAEQGKVVTIAPDAGAVDIQPQTRIVEEPSYWIGIRGRSIESVVLRTHLQLAEDMGVVVEDIVSDSPAAKAGLRKHDIILRANGDAVDNMQVLQSQVRTRKEKPLELTIIRLGKSEKVVVVPELRPEQLTEPAGAFDRFNSGLDGDVMQQFIEQFGARKIGPGMVFRGGGQRFDVNQMPNGVSVSIQRNDGGPAQITVTQGDDVWQIEGDDKESLKQLPRDVRPFVERMLNGQNNFRGFRGDGFDFGDFNAELEGILPRALGGIRPSLDGMGLGAGQEPAPDPMRKRIDELERKMQRLMKRIDEEPAAR